MGGLLWGGVEVASEQEQERAALNILMFQAPTDCPTEVSTLSGFSNPKFQSLYTILHKIWAGLSQQYPTMLVTVCLS